MTLKRDYEVNYCGMDITLPQGTIIQPVHHKYHDGVRTLYAVASIKQLIDLTHNSHDPHYRYCFIPGELVEGRIE